MKQKLLRIFTNFILSMSIYDFAWSAETIRIYSPYSPNHSGTPALRKIVDEANSAQSNYKFVIEFKPGGNQTIAVKSIGPESSVAIIAPAFVENTRAGILNKNNYVPVYALGDACWAVITNKSLTGSNEFVVGGVGFGNAAHLTALSLGDKYKFKVRYIVFKSNNDALINMVGNNGVEMLIDKYESYDSLKVTNSKLRMVAASCPTRLPQAPTIKTLKELGVDAPYIFNIVIAHRDMPMARREAIGLILNNATLSVGANEIYRLSAMRPPIFNNISTQEFYIKSIDQTEYLQLKYRDNIDSSK